MTKLLQSLSRAVTHPYWGSGSLIAKTAVSLASVMWGLVVLVDHSPMEPAEFPLYMTMVWAMPASHWGYGSVLLGLGTFLRLALRKPPIPIGSLAYFAMMMFWSYLAVSLWTLPLELRPAQASAVFVIGVLSVYAFLANPKHDPTK